MSNKINFEIELPWPYKELNPNHNTKQHWAKKAKYIKDARNIGNVICKELRPNITHIPGARLVSLRIFTPPNNLRYDIDNLGASMKPYQDGIFDYIQNEYPNQVIDDSQVSATVNVLNDSNKNQAGVTYYLLLDEYRSTWFEKIVAYVGLSGHFKARVG
jgi:hypothetical protein